MQFMASSRPSSSRPAAWSGTATIEELLASLTSCTPEEAAEGLPLAKQLVAGLKKLAGHASPTAGCLACMGKHRPHSCERYVKPRTPQGGTSMDECNAPAALTLSATFSAQSSSSCDARSSSRENADAPTALGLSAESTMTASTSCDARLAQHLKDELHIPEPLSYVSAALDILSDWSCVDMKPYAVKCDIRLHSSTWPRLAKIIKRLDWHNPPNAAVDTSRCEDATLIANLQLLLRVSTAPSGSHSRASRSECSQATIAVAVESLRDPQLHLLAAMFRHGVKGFRSRVSDAEQRVADIKRQVIERSLLSPDGQIVRSDLLCKPIPPALVEQVQEYAHVCVADAAMALALHGTVGAACAYVRKQRGDAPPAPPRRVGNGSGAAGPHAVAHDAEGPGIARGGEAQTEGHAEGDVDASSSLPLDDDEWLVSAQRRIGHVCRPHESDLPDGSRAKPVELPYLRVAIELAHVLHGDMDAICLKHGVSLASRAPSKRTYLRQVRDRVQATALTKVAPRELTHPIRAPAHSDAVIRSMQLRLCTGYNTHACSSATNVAIALDVFAEEGLSVETAIFRRQQSYDANRARAVKKLLEILPDVPPPHDAIVNDGSVERVQRLLRRSGLPDTSVPVVGVIADAVALHGPDDLVRAVNAIRAGRAIPPVDAAALASDDDGDGADDGEAAWSWSVKPEPIGEEVLGELRRRACLRLKRPVSQLPADKFFRAAADLCREGVRNMRVDRLNLGQVCTWHGIDLTRSRKAHLDRLKELRELVRDFGPLETLLTRRGLDDVCEADRILFANLRLLLQTRKEGAAVRTSRPPLGLSTIAVAVQLSRDPSLDIGTALQAFPSSSACYDSQSRHETVVTTRDRIHELSLLSLDHSQRIELSLVEELRRMVPASLGEAALAVAKHGASNLGAAADELAKQLGVVRDFTWSTPSEAEGLKLYLNPSTASGYTCVTKSSTGRCFDAHYSCDGVKVSLGSFGTAVEAAVAYARHRRQQHYGRDDRVRRGAEEESGSDGVEDGDDSMDEAAAGEVGSRQQVTAEAAAAKEARRQAACNLVLEPSLHEADASGVTGVCVSPVAAGACASFLCEHWANGQLLLPGCIPSTDDQHPSVDAPSGRVPDDEQPKTVFGWTTYGKSKRQCPWSCR